MSDKDKMARIEALMNKRLSQIESKLDDFISTSDSRAGRLSDKVSSLQATVDYMTTLIEQLSEKPPPRHCVEQFESVQIETSENQMVSAKEEEQEAHEMNEENAALVDANAETRSIDSTNSFAIIPTGMNTQEALKRGNRTISETSSFAEIEDDISECGTLIEDKDELVEGEKRDAKPDKDDSFEKTIVCSQRSEPRDEDELPVDENGEDPLSIEYAKQRKSIKKIQDRVYEECKSMKSSSTSSPAVSRQVSEDSSTTSRWSDATREQHNAMVEKQLEEFRGELACASIIAHSVGNGETPANSTYSIPSMRSSLTDSVNLDVRVDPFLTNQSVNPSPPQASPFNSSEIAQTDEELFDEIFAKKNDLPNQASEVKAENEALGQTGVQTADVLGRNHPAASLVNRMANAAPFEPRFQIPMSALESDPNRNQQALARAFEENHSVATVVNQTTADSMSHPRASNAETTAAVEQLKREFGAEHEPLIIAAMKKFGGNASDCKAFLNSRQLTTQFLIARFRLEDLDCQVDYDTLAQLTVTYDNISQVVNDYIEFEFQQQAMAPEAPRRRGQANGNFGVDRLIQYVSQKANQISSIITH